MAAASHEGGRTWGGDGEGEGAAWRVLVLRPARPEQS